MDQQQIIDAINQQLGGAGQNSGQNSGQGTGQNSGANAGSGAGFSVATTELTGYVRLTRQLADELHRLAKRKVNSVQHIAEDSFGKIGKETGFASALNNFAGALELQVNGVAKNADTLADGVAKTARGYRREDSELAENLLDLIN